MHSNARLVLERREAIDLGVGVNWGFRGNGDSVMRNRIDIDYSHSRAIVHEVGERLRASLEIDRELPANLRMHIDRLRQLGREPINSKRSADVRFGAHSGLKSDIA